MYHDQLTGHHQRLQRELAKAYATEIWDSPRIHRLTRDLAELDREIGALHYEEEDGAMVCASAAARANANRTPQRPVSLK